MIYWGMSGHGHDASISVYDDANKLYSINSDKKYHDEDMINLCKAVAKPDKIIWYENPYLKGLRQMMAGQSNFISRNNVSKILKELDLNCKWDYVPHHASHAAAYYNSGFDKAIIVSIDSIGEFNCTTVWAAYGLKMKMIGKVNYPDSLGLFYSAMTKAAGLIPNKEEKKFEELANSIKTKTGPLKLSTKNCLRDVERMIIAHPWAPMFTENFHRGIGDKFKKYSPEDIAYATQIVFEDLIIKIFKHWSGNFTNFILTGGCAFNQGVRNRITKEFPWRDLYVPLNPGDGGSSSGAVLYYLHSKIKNNKPN